MNKAKNWFRGLTAGGKVGAVLGLFIAMFLTVGVVGAAFSPNATEPDSNSTSQQPSGPKIETKTEEKKSVVEFKTVVKDDASLEKDTTEVEQNGVNGERTIVYQLTYTDGELSDRKEIKNEVTLAPVDKVVRRGTYVAPQVSTPNCDPNYTGGCVPVVSYDLDCPDIGFRVTVVGTDRHGFDGNDNDGLGCESY